MRNYFVSIIIPCKELDGYVQQCLRFCLDLNYDNYEIILLPDKPVNLNDSGYQKKIRIIPTGSLKPSQKRNIAVKESGADVLAFIDSDAYPVKDWLKNAVGYFEDETVGGVGGPSLTPPDDNMGQKISGYIMASPLATGYFALRYKLREKFRLGLSVKEMPACNLLIKRQLALAVDSFDGNLLTAEDSKLCFNIRKKLGKKIIYAPEVIVYHHRRNLWRPHLRQVWIYGRDKARLIKEDFSFDKLYYFIPLLFLLFLVFGAVLSLFFPLVRTVFLFLISFYLLIILAGGIITKPKFFLFIFLGIILTHLTYGLGFFYGLFRRK